MAEDYEPSIGIVCEPLLGKFNFNAVVKIHFHQKKNTEYYVGDYFRDNISFVFSRNYVMTLFLYVYS